MSSITIDLPDNLKFNNFELQLFLASKMYESGLLTSGQAAKIAGLSKRSFIEILGKYGVSVFSTSSADLSNDIDNA
jgi:predicted HTH domain antitoxin